MPARVRQTVLHREREGGERAEQQPTCGARGGTPEEEYVQSTQSGTLRWSRAPRGLPRDTSKAVTVVPSRLWPPRQECVRAEAIAVPARGRDASTPLPPWGRVGARLRDCHARWVVGARRCRQCLHLPAPPCTSIDRSESHLPRQRVKSKRCVHWKYAVVPPARSLDMTKPFRCPYGTRSTWSAAASRAAMRRARCGGDPTYENKRALRCRGEWPSRWGALPARAATELLSS